MSNLDPAQVRDVDVSIVTLHGVGAVAAGYSEPLRLRVVQGLARQGLRAEWIEGRWGVDLAREQAAWSREQAAQGRGGQLATMLTQTAGDALAVFGAAGRVLFSDVLGAVRRAQGERVVVVGHSLGGVLGWGVLASRPLAETSVRERVAGLVLLGAPVAWALLGGVTPPQPPPLPAAWSPTPILEIADADDPIGAGSIAWARWPAVRERVHRVTLGVGPWPIGATPAAHVCYWSSGRVADAVLAWCAGIAP